MSNLYNHKYPCRERERERERGATWLPGSIKTTYALALRLGFKGK